MQDSRLATREGSTLPRRTASVLALTFMALAGSLFMTQTAAHAFSPGGKGAVKLLPSVAKQAAGVTPWGRGLMTALTIANFAGLPMPWKQNPSVAPNSDQTTDPVTTTWPNGWAASELGRTYDAAKALLTIKYRITVGTVPDANGLQVYPYDVNLQAAHYSSSSGWNASGNTVILPSTRPTTVDVETVNVQGRTLSAACMLSRVTSSAAHKPVQTPLYGTVDSSPSGWPSNHLCSGLIAGSPAPAPTGTTGGTAKDPLRRLTPYSLCSGTGAGAVTGKIVGNIFNFKETETERPLIVPPTCPESMPHRTGFGATSQPLDANGNPDPAYAPAEVIPPIEKDKITPTAYPECIGPDKDCEVVKRKSAKPGQEIAPNGTTKAEPTPGSDGKYCTYGPYNVPAAECNDPDIPVADETTPVAEPTQENNCNLSDFSLNPVSWVVVPLKCLFIPRQSVLNGQTAGLREAWDGTAPGQAAKVGDTVFNSVTSLKDHTDTDGCQGPPFTIPVPFMDTTNADGTTSDRMWTIYPYTTCNELTQFVLGFAMPMMTAGTYLSGFFLGTRTILRTVNLDDGMT